MEKTVPLYQRFAAYLTARANCKKSGNTEWFGKWTKRIESDIADHMPSGSGVDSGTSIDFGKFRPDKRIVFTCSFHHMNNVGMYDGWTEHEIVLSPAFDGFNLKVTGRNRNDIKEYLGDLYHEALITPVPMYDKE